MSYIKIEMNIDGAAFYNEDGEFIPHWEVSKILKKLANKYERNEKISDGTIKDTNGNTMGFVVVEIDE